MPPSFMIYPVFVQVALTFVLLFAMGRSRARAFISAKLKFADMRLGEDVWPQKTKQIGNAFHNQLELPILFYTAVLFAIALNRTDWIFFGLACFFSVSRIFHALVHTGSNNVVRRRSIYALGALAILAMWIWLLVKTAV